MMIIFFTRTVPNSFATELSRQGHTVHEALAISEVLALAQEHPEAQIVIAADVEDERAKVIQEHYPTLQLSSGANAAEIIFELSHLSSGASLQ